MPKRYNYDEHERLFARLRELARGVLSPEEWKVVTEFVDAGEYGVAFETFCWIVSDKKKVISVEIYQTAEQLGLLMDIDPATWKPLAEHVGPGA